MPASSYQVQIPVNIFREGEHFVAHSPVLDLSSSGRTFEEAQTRFKEALDMFLGDLIERGTLEEVLESHGWYKVINGGHPRLVPPKLVKSVEQEALISFGA